MAKTTSRKRSRTTYRGISKKGSRKSKVSLFRATAEEAKQIEDAIKKLTFDEKFNLFQTINPKLLKLNFNPENIKKKIREEISTLSEKDKFELFRVSNMHTFQKKNIYNTQFDNNGKWMPNNYESIKKYLGFTLKDVEWFNNQMYEYQNMFRLVLNKPEHYVSPLGKDHPSKSIDKYHCFLTVVGKDDRSNDDHLAHHNSLFWNKIEYRDTFVIDLMNAIKTLRKRVRKLNFGTHEYPKNSIHWLHIHCYRNCEDHEACSPDKMTPLQDSVPELRSFLTSML